MKLGIFSQLPDSATSYYRAIFPFKALARSMGFTYEVIGGVVTETRSSKLFEFDVVFMTRPHDPMHITLLRALKHMGTPIWVDFDDDLFSIPFDHTSWEYFQMDSTREAIVQGCGLADVITVTTETLKKVLVAKGADETKIYVIPNAVNDYLFPEPTPHDMAKNRFIAWRGGFTHDRDLLAIGPTVALLIKHGYRFAFLGHNPYIIEQYLQAGKFTRLPFEQDIFSYFFSLKRVNAPFHIIPLNDNGLNRSKSNLGYLESVWIGGSVAIQPTWCAEKLTAIHYENGDDLICMMTDEKFLSEMRPAHYERAVEHIRNNYLLSFVNLKREMLLNEVLKR